MKEIHSEDELALHLKQHSLQNVALQNIDLTPFESQLRTMEVDGCILLGCKISDSLLCWMHANGAIVFPELDGFPYQPFRSSLYDHKELFNDFQLLNPCSYCDTADARIYQHYLETGKANPVSIRESLARRMHDHSVTDALRDFLTEIVPKRRGVIAIMGGHSMRRDSDDYAAIAKMSRDLARENYLMVSGGGPGAMEATHVGTWFVERTDAELYEAIAILSRFLSPGETQDYQQPDWLSNAYRVLEKFPASPGDRHISLGIPTWLYGHEPPNPFATHIAKYFANSVREDGLVTIATEGIIFSPGSFGTIQEIFQDATQNHYATESDLVSPMVFLGKDYWQVKKPVFKLLESLASGENGSQLGDYLTITDDPNDAIAFIKSHPPRAGRRKSWSFCDAFCSD